MSIVRVEQSVEDNTHGPVWPIRAELAIQLDTLPDDLPELVKTRVLQVAPLERDDALAETSMSHG